MSPGARYVGAEPFVVDAAAARAFAEAVGAVPDDGHAPAALAVSAGAGAFTAPLLDPRVDVDLMRLVHRDVDARFLAPVRLGARLSSTATLAGLVDEPLGRAILVDVETRDGDVPVCAARHAFFARRPRARGDAPPAVPAADETPASWTFRATAARVRSFVDAVGDPNPLYVDDDAARSANLPRAIAPPLFVLAVVHARLDAPPRIAARFAFPALVDAEVAVRAGPGGFAATSEGRVVVERGELG